jgi:hypothetical protein
MDDYMKSCLFEYDDDFNSDFAEVVKVWQRDDLIFEIVKITLHPIVPSHYCGYVSFPGVTGHPDEVFEEQVDVHGGITFMQTRENSIKFGFDCGHGGDAEDPRCQNIVWLVQECERMADQIAEII